MRSLFVCPDCASTSDRPGECPYCGRWLEPVEDAGYSDPHDEEDDEC
jgi:predicted ATP-dependent serine protease